MCYVATQHLLQEWNRVHSSWLSASGQTPPPSAAPASSRPVWRHAKRRRQGERLKPHAQGEWMKAALPQIRLENPREPWRPLRAHQRYIMRLAQAAWKNVSAEEKRVWKARAKLRVETQAREVDRFLTAAETLQRDLRSPWGVGDQAFPIAKDLYEMLDKEHRGQESFVKSHASRMQTRCNVAVRPVAPFPKVCHRVHAFMSESSTEPCSDLMLGVL